MAKRSSGIAPTPDHGKDHEKTGPGGLLYGPLYEPPEPGGNLGPHPVEGPTSGMSIPDPLGISHGHSGGKKRKGK